MKACSLWTLKSNFWNRSEKKRRVYEVTKLLLKRRIKRKSYFENPEDSEENIENLR